MLIFECKRLSVIRHLALLVVFCSSAIAGTCGPVVADDRAWRVESFTDDWGDNYGDKPDRALWADYYARNARVSLGPEKRLRNGISWRVVKDSGTGVSMPRITWMPDKRRLWVANHLLDTVHGGAMLFAMGEEEDLRSINESRRQAGYPLLEYRYAVVQRASALTYASKNLVSVIDTGYIVSEGTGAPRIIRGLTFDLRSGRIFKMEPCPGKKGDYAEKNRLFRFGELLDLCYPGKEYLFLNRVQAASDRAMAASAEDKNDFVQQCRSGRFVPEGGEYSLYLTFEGLAVQITSYGPNSDSGCALLFNALNPVIIPYRDLEPLMEPGPWRDELLK